MSNDLHDDDRVHQYVAGTLGADDRDDFEAHLLTCRSCRDAVRVGAAARAALIAGASASDATPVAGPGRPATLRLRPRTRWLGLAVAAAVTFMIVTRKGESADPLGQIAPPVWRPAEVRAASGPDANLVDRGMQAYAASRYADAARLLGEAARTDSSAGVAFYHGAALLAAKDPANAVAPLLRAQRPAGNPFSGDATLLAAKALIRLRLADSALAVLTRAPDTNSLALRAFADSIRTR